VEQDVVDRAVTGDERAFAELVEPYRRELRVHCYRMLGSLTDAEDVLQETLLAAWRGLAGFERRSSVRAWLYRIATNRCLNAIRDGRRRIPAEPVPPFDLPEPSRRSDVPWLQPYPGPETHTEARESVELAFVAGLQRLPPRQAATLVLRDVLGYSQPEVADMLGTTPTAVKGALQRARATMARPHRPRAARDEEERLSRRFADAFVRRDLAGLLALLTDDVWLSMPPAPHEYHGRAAVAAFLTASWAGGGRIELDATRANGQPAFACHLDAEPAGIMVLTCHGDGISAMTRFLPATL